MAKDISAVNKSIDTQANAVKASAAIAPPEHRSYRAAIFQGYIVLAIIIFLVLAVLAHTIAYFTFDVTITRALQTIDSSWFAAFMYGVSWIGFVPQKIAIIVAVLVFLYASGLKWETIVSVVSVLGISALEFSIKQLVDRPRPAADLVNVIRQLTDYSFPSGHVLFFTTFFGFLLFLAYTLLKPMWWRTVLIIIFGALVGLVGLSRIYEGQHWASDVFAAYLLGSVWLGLSIYIYRRGKARFFVNQPTAKATPDSAGSSPQPS